MHCGGFGGMQGNGFHLHGHDGRSCNEVAQITGGKLQVAEPGERNRKSLEDLGLDVLMEIDPEDASWRDVMDGVRSRLVACKTSDEDLGRGVHVLDAHKKLCEADEKNIEKFGTVLDYLEAEVQAKDADK